MVWAVGTAGGALVQIDELTLSRTAGGLPARFAAWFESRGWQPHAHQLEMLQAAAEGASCLLIAPTGGGKTLAGFLPSLVELAEAGGGRGIHTLYVSPLKALTTDIARNLAAPIAEMALAIRCETWTGLLEEVAADLITEAMG